ncbi:MAG: Rpn family recombination-promoting nuclease/putative transposase [Desmonostoc vinosum HA7617-LM4]|jgi:predicted transposase/invertase (TIGR01784 family)|nr:Rpn family recombination-promoting nuclease/putative transposase [Desmonostoc vinosum HA7617-LM4]
MNRPQTEFYTPWKDILQEYFEDFMQFFFPQAHAEIDWTRKPEFLDKELQQVVKDAELGRRLVDKLVKIYLIGGQETWLLIHIEVQSQEEENFAQRMFVYNYRIYDRYKRSVASLAVLGDEQLNWRPNQFGYQLFDCQMHFQFPTVKLLDYQQRWSELEASYNPFATVVMAHLKALETRSNFQQRLQSKLLLTKRLYERGFKREDIINLFGFIDWMMSLSNELQQEFEQQLIQYEEKRKVPYITSLEKRAIQKGIEQGIEQGLLEGIELALELKFGDSGLNLMLEISQIKNIEKLRAIKAALKTVQTVEELQSIYSRREGTGDSEQA